MLSSSTSGWVNDRIDRRVNKSSSSLTGVLKVLSVKSSSLRKEKRGFFIIIISISWKLLFLSNSRSWIVFIWWLFGKYIQ